jgi:hypothetical protein
MGHPDMQDGSTPRKSDSPCLASGIEIGPITRSRTDEAIEPENGPPPLPEAPRLD